MQFIVDTYNLEYVESENKYYISFKDSVDNEYKIEINKEIFETYKESKKSYIKIKNEFSRYIEHSELTEITLYNRCMQKNKKIEELIINEKETESITEIIWKLPNPQNRRVYMRVIEKFTISKIAKIEGCSKSAISQSVRLGIEKILKNLKKI